MPAALTLSFSFVRTQGPNPRYQPCEDGAHHWFDGTGLLHSLRLRGHNNTAEYSARYVRTRGFLEEEAAGKRLSVSLSQPPRALPILRGLASKFTEPRVDAPYWVIQSANHANNGVKAHAGVLLVTYEAGSAHAVQLSPDLPTLGVHTFNGSWVWSEHWTENVGAHAKTCPTTGELIYTGYNLVPISGPPTVSVGVVSPSGAVTHRAVLPAARPVLFHDVGITRTRTLLLDGPLVFNLQKSMKGGRPFDFHRGSSLRVGVLPRRGAPSDAVWIDTRDACFAYHVANAWDDPTDADRVVLILCRMDETRAVGMADALQPDGSVAADAPGAPAFVEEGRLHKYVLDVRNRTVVSSSPLSPLCCDFPAVHPSFVGRVTSRAFAAGMRLGFDDPIPIFDSLISHNLDDGTAVVRRLPPGVACGDITVAPRDAANPTSDTDGHVLLLTHILGENRSELLVLDAADILADPVATIQIPARIPFGFHATWVAGPLPEWP